MVVTLLATADRPAASAWAPVPAKFDAMVTVRGKAVLFSAVGLQSSFATAMPRKYPSGESINTAIGTAKSIECFLLHHSITLLYSNFLSAYLFGPRIMFSRPDPTSLYNLTEPEWYGMVELAIA